LFGKFNKKKKIFLFYYQNSRTINGLGSLFGLAINMAISYFLLKIFHNMQGTKPSTGSRPNSSFRNIGKVSPTSDRSRV